MVKFYHTVKSAGFAFAFLTVAALQVSAQEGPAALSIEVADIKSTDATVTITPADSESGFFYALKTKTDYDEAGGAATVVETQINGWKNMASWYDDTDWTYFMNQNKKTGPQQFSAKEELYASLFPETEYVVYAYGLDAEGNVTIPVTEKLFTTAAPIASDNTFRIKLDKVETGKFSRMNATVTVTPANEDNYTIQYVSKAVADEYDLSTPGSESYKEFIREEILANLAYDETYSGSKTVVFERLVNGTEYSVFVIGLDVDGAPSTVLTRFDFTAEEYVAPAPAVEISVSNVKSTDAEITITPNDVDFGFFFDVKTKAAYDAAGGADTVVETQINGWKNTASYYDDTDWTYFMNLNKKTGIQQISAKEFLMEALMPETEYVVYAYGLDAEGNLTAPVTEKNFTTAAAIPSDNTFTVKLVSVEAGRFGRMVATAKVSPTSQDAYTAQFIQKSAADEYDLSTPGSDSYKDFIREKMLYGLSADEIVSGEHDFTYERCNADEDYCLFVIGLDQDRAPSTELTRFDFVAKQYPEPLPKIEIELNEITPMNAHIKVTPPDDEIYYYVDLSPASIVEEKGGDEMIPEKLIIDWWKFLADIYSNDVKWQDFIPLHCVQGTLDAKVADLYEDGKMSSLYWGNDWVLYAVGFNTEGEVITDVAVSRFSTPVPETTDLTFSFEEVSYEKDEKASDAWGRTMFNATIDIYPSDPELPYKFNYMRTVILDQYDDGEEDSDYEFITGQFLENSITATDAARVVMPSLSATRAGQTQEYYLVAMGWNEGPTTPIFKYKFSYDENAAITEVSDGSEARVCVEPGRISLLGNCDGAAVYSAAGQLVGSLRSGRSINVPAGLYVISYKVNGKTVSKKVVVK